MTEPTGPASTSRPPVVPIVLGLLLVAAVIAVALLIERATDGHIDLPDDLPGGLSSTSISESQRETVANAEEALEQTLEFDVTVETYVDDGAERQATITVVDDAAGPFAPSGPQPDPETLGLERSPYELVRDGDTTCEIAWGAPVPEGEDVPDDDPVGVHCQLGANGHTYWLNGRGLSADDAVEILESVTD
jgi:hypothetical protein